MKHDVLFYGEHGTHIATMSNCASFKDAKSFASTVHHRNEEVLGYKIKNHLKMTVFSKGMRRNRNENNDEE